MDLWLVFAHNGTFDAGDSVLHYLYSKQAFDYPKYFFDHWAKPFFVLLSAPFAQFGFEGIKVFNTLCTWGAAWFIHKILKTQGWKFPLWSILLLYLAIPEVLQAQQSGLTEPLFALMLVACLYLWLVDQQSWSMVLFSFSPFVRSEGWILMVVIVPLLLWNKSFKELLLLSIGSIIYSVAGSFHHKNLLWVFQKNPYQGVEVKYGSGSWTHYFEQLPYLLGLVVLVLFVLSHGVWFRELLKKRLVLVPLLCFLLFWGFFGAHTIFWYKGWFHSFGLKRVFLAVLPLVVLFVFSAFGAMSHRSEIYKYLGIGGAVLALLFLFTRSPMAVQYPKDFSKNIDQRCVAKAVDYLNENYTNLPRVSYGLHQFAVDLDLDMDDTTEVLLIDQYKNLKPGDLILWDSYFSPSDKGVSLDMLEADSTLKILHTAQETEGNRVFEVRIFEKE
jgi:hypothetical protein